MDPYAEVDPIIEACVKARGATLFTEWAGEPARFFHIPGARPFECFQISIGQPSAGRMAVRARSIDTDDGSEFEERWEATAETLNRVLASATQSVDGWRDRLPD
jgi:hypothetical protein